jgi:antitoxin (DNA-binding transcriptional repressor) of toxin-antitoxin stability system
MAEVNLHEAKTQLSRPLQRVEKSGESVVAKAGRSRRTFGHDRGLFVVPDDFDEPLPDEFRDLFEQ